MKVEHVLEEQNHCRCKRFSFEDLLQYIELWQKVSDFLHDVGDCVKDLGVLDGPHKKQFDRTPYEGEQFRFCRDKLLDHPDIQCQVVEETFDFPHVPEPTLTFRAFLEPGGRSVDVAYICRGLDLATEFLVL